jgi:ribonuclease P protein component
LTHFIFPPSHRIRQSREFELAFSAKAISNKWFSIHVVNGEHESPRLGMVVSKRVMPKSVSRNFAKRLIRELFRLHSAELPAKDFVVKVRKSFNTASSGEAKLALLQLMQSV